MEVDAAEAKGMWHRLWPREKIEADQMFREEKRRELEQREEERKTEVAKRGQLAQMSIKTRNEGAG